MFKKSLPCELPDFTGGYGFLAPVIERAGRLFQDFRSRVLAGEAANAVAESLNEVAHAMAFLDRRPLDFALVLREAPEETDPHFRIRQAIVDYADVVSRDGSEGAESTLFDLAGAELLEAAGEYFLSRDVAHRHDRLLAALLEDNRNVVLYELFVLTAGRRWLGEEGVGKVRRDLGRLSWARNRLDHPRLDDTERANRAERFVSNARNMFDPIAGEVARRGRLGRTALAPYLMRLANDASLSRKSFVRFARDLQLVVAMFLSREQGDSYRLALGILQEKHFGNPARIHSRAARRELADQARELAWHTLLVAMPETMSEALRGGAWRMGDRVGASSFLAGYRERIGAPFTGYDRARPELLKCFEATGRSRSDWRRQMIDRPMSALTNNPTSRADGTVRDESASALVRSGVAALLHVVPDAKDTEDFRDLHNDPDQLAPSMTKIVDVDIPRIDAVKIQYTAKNERETADAGSGSI